MASNPLVSVCTSYPLLSRKSFCDCRLSISSSTQRIFANAILSLFVFMVVLRGEAVAISSILFNAMYPTFVLLFHFCCVALLYCNNSLQQTRRGSNLV